MMLLRVFSFIFNQNHLLLGIDKVYKKFVVFAEEVFYGEKGMVFRI